MDIPYQINFQVEQLNKPDDVLEISTYTVNASLDHKIHHIKELIWIYSDNYQLKPLFLKLRYNGHALNDLDTVEDIYSQYSDAEGDLGWKLVIDYTLFHSPFIPSKDPVPTYFDIEVDGTLPLAVVKHYTREFLGTSVEEIKSEISERFHVSQSEFDLLYNGTIQQPSRTLREALGLDVPPLLPVRMTVAPSAQNIKLILHPMNGGEPFILNIVNSTTFAELKEKLSKHTGKDPSTIALYEKQELISAGLSFPDTRPVWSASKQPLHIYFKHVPLKEFQIDGESWHRLGETLTGLLTGDGRKVWVNESNISSQYYTIQSQDKTLKFSTSELIMNESEGYVLMNANAFARIQSVWPFAEGETNSLRGTQAFTQSLNITNTGTQQGTSRVITGAATPTATTTLAESLLPTPTGPNLANEENAGEQDANEMDLNADHLVQQLNELRANLGPVPNLPNLAAVPQGNQSVLARIQRAIVANGQNIFQFGFQAVIVVVLFGFDIFLSFMKPEILTFLAIAGTLSMFFWCGGSISNWIEEAILRDAPMNQVDFQLVQKLAQVFRFCNNITVGIHSRILSLILAVLPKLIRPRYELLAKEISGEMGPLQNLARVIGESVGIIVMFCATLLPSLQEGIEQFWVAERNSEPQNIRTEIERNLHEIAANDHGNQFQKIVEASIGRSVAEILALNDDMESLLELFVTVVRTKKAYDCELHQAQQGQTSRHSSFELQAEVTPPEQYSGGDESHDTESEIEPVPSIHGSTGSQVNGGVAGVAQR